MNEEINIIFPNQLFQNSEIIQNKKDTYIIEENLFFNQYKFHKHKIAYHRSSMQKYKDYLISKDINVIYIDSQDKLSDIRNFIKENYKNLKKINLYDPVDNWLLKRLNLYSKNIELIFFENPLFLNASINLPKPPVCCCDNISCLEDCWPVSVSITKSSIAFSIACSGV